jgi:hypothetical protein
MLPTDRSRLSCDPRDRMFDLAKEPGLLFTIANADWRLRLRRNQNFAAPKPTLRQTTSYLS